MALLIHHTPAEAKVGQRVVYIPRHLHDDPTALTNSHHREFEYGKVTSWNPQYCFVQYERGQVSQATDWDCLVLKED